MPFGNINPLKIERVQNEGQQIGKEGVIPPLPALFSVLA
nr:MAG TPA: hypothetical protein [Caudoviricetes sp.]